MTWMASNVKPDRSPVHDKAAGWDWRKSLVANDVFVILVVFGLAAAIFNPAFRGVPNLSNLLTQSSLLGLLAMGQFLVILCGGFDLSVAAVMALSSLVFAHFAPLGFFPASLLAIGAGAACGLFNGFAITWGRVQPLIATLAMMGIARGLALSISEKSMLVSEPFLDRLRAFDGFLSVPTLVWLVVIVAMAAWCATSRPALHVLAIGGNEATARLAGVSVDMTKIGVYTAAGTFSGIAGIVLVIRSGSGVPLGGMGWELDTIAAIVIGGTNLFGGEGRLLRAMAGVLIYQMIANVMNLSGVDPYYQNIVRAAVIISAVGLSMIRPRRGAARAIAGRRVAGR